jgi:flagellar hook-associated protein 3 FlgL
VTYAGDQGSRLIQVSTSQSVPDSHSGFDLFMNIPEGNGSFVTSLNPANTGGGMIDAGSLIDRNAWAASADTYTITFTSATEWAVNGANAAVNPVHTGTYTPGEPIEFAGVRVQITGEPAPGDAFEVRNSRAEDMFTTVRNVITALRQPEGGTPGNAQLAGALGGALQQMDRIQDHVLGVRAQVGARLSTLDTADSARESLKIDLESSLSDLRDLDYAEALTKLNQRLVGLQAAQMSYSKISQLSLFNYLR